MWLDSEITKLSKLYNKIKQPEIEEIFGTDDLQCIKDLNSTELAVLKNNIFVPKVI